MLLIDVAALIDAHYKACNEDTEKEFPAWSLALMEQAPTIDAEPVRHGKWVEDDVDRWRCSECNKGNNYAYSWHSTRGNILQDHYCPACGAKMDGR